MRIRRHVFVALASLTLLAGSSRSAVAQSDEIQVYDGGLADPGVLNLTWHNNYIPKGVKDQAFPGANVADKSFNGVTEWAYGVTPWFEAGLYLPLYSIDKNLGGVINGMKLRALFAAPNGDARTFVYGVNFEFSINATNWDSNRITSEIRPIIGWHLKPFDIIVNPILDTAYDGVKNLEFVPATRIAYNVNDTWAVAAEHYADYGPLRNFLPLSEQSHQIYAVVDRTSKAVDIQFGVGFGLTDASDKLTLKLIVARNLTRGR